MVTAEKNAETDFATNISRARLVSLAPAGFEEGPRQGNFEWMAAFSRVLFALFSAPFHIRPRNGHDQRRRRGRDRRHRGPWHCPPARRTDRAAAGVHEPRR
jgi:hypothetical protein